VDYLIHLVEELLVARCSCHLFQEK